jgi:ArsR family transcriptional regulator, arsenate/arsenite/antimonite-responsive transcriptional repressor
MVPGYISTMVNIEVHRYNGNMRTSKDRDVSLLQAVGDPTRLAILRQLATLDEVCACDFTACCDVSQPTVSHHLRVLREAGWVTSERRGTWVYYRLQPEAAERFRRLGEELTPAAAVAPPGAASRRLPVMQPS